MAESEYQEYPEETPQRGRKALIIAGVALIVLIVAYFFLSSSFFFKAVILPKAGDSLNARITAEKIRFSPFSKVQLQGLQIFTTGKEPVIAAERALVDYSLWKIIRGDTHLQEAALESPVIRIVQYPDGSTNLDPLLKEDPDKPDRPSKDERVRLNVQALAINNGALYYNATNSTGTITQATVKNLDFNLSDLGNNKSGSSKLSAEYQWRVTHPPESQTEPGQLTGSASGEFRFALGSDLEPKSIDGQLAATISEAQGAFAPFNQYQAVLVAKMSPTQIEEVALRFLSQDQLLAAIRLNGPLDLAAQEGRLNFAIESLDRDVLNLFGAPAGLDFAGTKINAKGVVNLNEHGTIIGLNGSFSGRDVSVQHGPNSTPIAGFDLEYNLTVNQSEKLAIINRFNVLATQSGQAMLSASLDRPMTISLGQVSRSFTRSQFTLAITNFNTREWAPIIGDKLPASGIVDATAVLSAERDGKQLNAEVESHVSNIDAMIGTNQVTNASLQWDAQGQLDNFAIFNLRSLRFTVADAEGLLAKGSSSGRIRVDSPEMNIQFNLEAPLPSLLRYVPVENLSATKGQVTTTTVYTHRSNKRTVSGNVQLANFTGAYEDYTFAQYGVASDYNIELSQELLTIYRFSAEFRDDYRSGGSVALSGKYGLQSKNGAFNARLLSLNENALRPFLQPLITGKELVSATVEGTASIDYNPDTASGLNAQLKLSNWVARDPAVLNAPKPGGLAIAIDLTSTLDHTKKLFHLENATLGLTPTDRADNQLKMKGNLDLKNLDAIAGTLDLQANALDLTPYHDLLAEPAQPEAQPAPDVANAPTPSPAPTGEPTQEPEPILLPVEQLTAKLNVNQAFLREIALSNFLAEAHITSNHIVIDPATAKMNGAPISFTADIGTDTPGFQYALAFSADQIPLEPIANSFMPERRGMFQGDIFANVKLRGLGITGPNLRQHLDGNLNLNFTNATIRAVAPWIQNILTPIATVLGAPDLLSEPLRWISAQVDIGNGEIVANDFRLVSAAFHATTQGQAPIADNLMASPILDWPLNLAIRRGIAERIKLVPANAPPDAEFIDLPVFVQITGTLESPATEINKSKLLGFGLQRFADDIPGLDKKTGNILENIGGVLSGQRPGTGTQPSSTNNVPATNAPPKNRFQDLLDLIPKK